MIMLRRFKFQTVAYNDNCDVHTITVMVIIIIIIIIKLDKS